MKPQNYDFLPIKSDIIETLRGPQPLPPKLPAWLPANSPLMAPPYATARHRRQVFCAAAENIYCVCVAKSYVAPVWCPETGRDTVTVPARTCLMTENTENSIFPEGAQSSFLGVCCLGRCKSCSALNQHAGHFSPAAAHEP